MVASKLRFVYSLLLPTILALTGCGTAELHQHAKYRSRDSGREPAADARLDPSIKQARDILYQEPDGWDTKLARLDLYYRDDGTPKDILVFVHGGSWVSGDKAMPRRNPHFLEFFLDHGYIVAIVNYRLINNDGAPGTTYQDQATDIARAIQWLSLHAEAYGGNSTGFVLYGHSAGAYLVALVGTDSRYLESVGMSTADLKGVISSDVHVYDVPFALEMMKGTGYERKIPFIRSLFGSTEEEQLEASPIHYTKNPNISPYLCISSGYRAKGRGTLFRDLPKRACDRFDERLRQDGHQASSAYFPNEDHGSLVKDLGTPGDGPTRAIEDFLAKLQAPATTTPAAATTAAP